MTEPKTYLILKHGTKSMSLTRPEDVRFIQYWGGDNPRTDYVGELYYATVALNSVPVVLGDETLPEV